MVLECNPPVLDGFNWHYQASVHFTLRIAVNKTLVTTKNSLNKFLGMLGIKPRAAGWEARMLPMCYAATSHAWGHFPLNLEIGQSVRVTSQSQLEGVERSRLQLSGEFLEWPSSVDWCQLYHHENRISRLLCLLLTLFTHFRTLTWNADHPSLNLRRYFVFVSVTFVRRLSQF